MAKDNTTSKYLGTNIQAYIATLIGLAFAIVGQFVPALSTFNDISWIAGFLAAGIIYMVIRKNK